PQRGRVGGDDHVGGTVETLRSKDSNADQLPRLEGERLDDGAFRALSPKQITAQIEQAPAEQLAQALPSSRVAGGGLQQLRERAGQGERAARRSEVGDEGEQSEQKLEDAIALLERERSGQLGMFANVLLERPALHQAARRQVVPILEKGVGALVLCGGLL